MAIYINGQRIQNAYIGGAQARKCYVGGQLVFGGQQPQPSVLIPLEYYVPSANAPIRTDSSMTHGWEIVATMQANSASAEFFCGYQSGATNAYLASVGGTMRVYGSASQTGSKALGTDKAVIDINCHMADITAPGDPTEYEWMFLNYNWDGHTQTAAAGFQVAYASVNGIYPDAAPQFYTDGGIKLYSYDVYYQAKNDKTTKTKTRSYEPYYDVTNDKIVMKSGEEYSWDAQGAAGYRKGAEPVSFVGSSAGYIHDNKVWSDSLCYTTLYTAGTYTSSDGWEYVIASDGTYTKRPVSVLSNKISGHTRSVSQTITIKINDVSHSVSSNTSGYFELDCSAYYPITSMVQALYNQNQIKDVVVDIDTSSAGSFNSAFSNLAYSTGTMDFSSVNLAASTTWQNMFYNMQQATIIYPRFTHGRVVSAQLMFYNNKKTTKIDMSALGNVQYLSSANGMFQSCTALTEIDFSGTTGFAPSNTTNMFNSCSALQRIKVTGCDSTTKSTLISALSDAGYTFVESSGYLIKQ